MIVIAIYDEASPYADPQVYGQDVGDWIDLVEEREGRLTIRGGLFAPGGSLFAVTHNSGPLPKDSDRPMIDFLATPMQSPRVTQQEILDFFETIRTTPDEISPKLLLFVLDNSGSIVVSSYEAELNAAKDELRSLYPDMEILDDISNAGERWLRDMRVGSENEGCP